MSDKRRVLLAEHKRKALLVLVLCLVVFSVGACELLLRALMGLGNPVLYDSSPVYGYRPLPNQECGRFRGATIKINNLGLRAEQDWDAQKRDKILFLGDSVTYGGSYIDNADLFSELAVQRLNRTSGGHYVSGNAGVNAWGVENIHALIVERKFLPAAIYITTLPEGDFYRGLTRMQGLPFFNHKPRTALTELWRYFCYRQNNGRYRGWTETRGSAGT